MLATLSTYSRLFALTAVLLVAAPGVHALESRVSEATVDTLPQVFMIGQNEIKYEDLVAQCSSPLLTVCQDSMDLAYRRWMGLLSDMEQYAEKSEFDIKGIKIWLNVFWNSDGSIKHLVYFPKPNSRNMDFDDLTKFMFKFVDSYVMDSNHDTCYSHYGSATFPTFAEYYLGTPEGSK